MVIEKEYKKGLKYLEHKDYEPAIECFSKCIQLDDLYLNGYYNRAYSYYMLKRTDQSCMDWSKLMELGQKTGEKFYLEKCNNSN